MRDRLQVDGVLLGAVLVLCLIGVLMVYSSSAILASVEASSQTAYLRSQIPKLLLGMLSLGILSRLPYYKLRGRATDWAAGLSLAALAALLLPLGLAAAGRGTHRFLDLGFLQLQPAEFARLALILFLAAYASHQKSWVERGWKGLRIPVGLIWILAGLILLQPNLSSAVVLVGLGYTLLYLAGQPILRLVLAAAPLPLAALALHPYQYYRVTQFFHGGSGGTLPYQVEQSLIALGSGGIVGRGLGQGVQKYFYLPFPHTDFILGIVGEEWGFLGVLTLFILFGIVIVRGLRIARYAPDSFSQLLAAGLTLSLAANFLLHAGVTLGVGPVTGVPLPFISHGGSSLLVNLMAMGILLSISRSACRPPDPFRRVWGLVGRPSRAE
jgi:cell division protein FtsW